MEQAQEAVQEDDDEEEQRDHEMEKLVAVNVREDPLAAYDVDCTEEGEAIREYLALVGDELVP